MSAYEHRNLVALDAIEDLLEAYADARLAPGGPVMRRIRRAVMLEAAAAAALQAAEARAVDLASARNDTRRLVPFSLAVPRRVAAIGLGVALTFATSAAVLAAPPGTVFFEARIALEGLFLPAQTDARLAAHEEHLEQRLAEAQAAAEHGDGAALAAALAAYQAEVDAALAELGDDAALLARLEAALGTHVALLTALEAQVPGQAAIDRALESSQKALGKIKDTTTHGKPGDAPAGPPSTPGGRP